MIIYKVYDQQRNEIARTPVKAQAVTIAKHKAVRTGKIYGVAESFLGCREWYSANGFICRSM